MNPLRSVGARLSLALAVLVAGALGTVYFAVVPSLQHNLVHAKLSQLERAAPVVRHNYNPFDPDFVQTTAETTSARVVIFRPLAFNTLRVVEDSGASSSEVENDPVALKASQTGRQQSGTIDRGDTRFAEVAVTKNRDVVLLSASLRDALANVRLVQRRLIAAGIAALLASLAIGYGAASMFARRIRRLERAAERISAGEFDEPVADDGADELGQLAHAFERMRGQLAQLDHARREFIANASHELRTPLFSLGGFLELLAEEELDDETRRDFVTTMREQVDRLTKLATELLDLSRLDAGRLQVESERVDLEALAGVLVDEFRGVARAREHGLEASAESALALGDVDRAHQIGSTLVENALVHTPPGTRVCVRTGRRAGGCELAVEDDGPGIPPEHAERVFERFYRIDGSVAYGSGLGLAIARELAQLMGGRLELESEPGRTVFRLVLPAAVEAPQPELAGIA